MTNALDRDSPVPLWAQLVERLRARAEAGEFADDFPSEPRLVAEYGVSRHTVREALRRLRESGAVVSHRGRGSKVVGGHFDQQLGTLYSLFRTIEATGVPQRSEVLDLAVTVDPAAAARLDLPGSSQLVVLSRRRLAGDEPLALDTAWLPASLAGPLLAVDFTRTALYDELAARCGIRVDGGREEISPVVPDQYSRDLLGITAETGAFALHRSATAGGRLVEWRTTLIRGDRYRFVATWAPGRPQQVGLAPGDAL